MKATPRFWSAAESGVETPEGHHWFLRKWGWSDVSVEDAAAQARERLQQVITKVRTGQELGWDYYPRTPLREPILADVTTPDGTLIAQVTRNRYGTDVLNTDRMLIADVDLAVARRRGPLFQVTEPGGLLGRLFGRRDVEQVAPSADEQAEQAAMLRIQQWAAAHPDWGVHVYRTNAGLRVLVTGADLPAGSAAAEQALNDLRSDPIYVLLCATHETYRARLTPKPWRVRHWALTVPWPHRSPADDRRFQEWITGYVDKSAAYATCRLVWRAGPPPSPAEQQLLALHDQVTRVGQQLPLA
ncbi:MULTISPECIES: hypothetical protein [Barrientosiimonas]|uniref:Uncharacterized protein n=1 Tax=Barrientosiimonas endolithica TaxID=1535208 RepID=A0ABN6YJM0_9MICO|nr:hypothetical protein [Barrientosiimonas endolithica]BDZ57667.1 hypothetical protein GCM10025872_13240 [Barrientosiimonas endolithica]